VDVEMTSTVVALRTLARRAHTMLQEARELQNAILAIIRSWRPDLLEQLGPDRSSQQRCCAPIHACTLPRP